MRTQLVAATVTLGALLVAVVSGAPAFAQPEPAPQPALAPPSRPTSGAGSLPEPAPPPRGVAVTRPARQLWGVGVSVGGGYARGPLRLGQSKVERGGPVVSMGAVEARFFSRSGWSIDLWLPLVNAIVITGAKDYTFGWLGDALFDFNLDSGIGNMRFLVGPGLGLGLFTGGGATLVQLRIPAVIGVEWVTDSKRWGLQIAARPYLTVRLTSDVEGVYERRVGGGVIGGIGLLWYSLVR